MSRTATDDNFGYHIPTQDTDSIQIRFAARDGNGVKHLVTMSDLLIFDKWGTLENVSGWSRNSC